MSPLLLIASKRLLTAVWTDELAGVLLMRELVDVPAQGVERIGLFGRGAQQGVGELRGGSGHRA